MSELDDPRRLAAFQGPILKLDADGVLDECVRGAAAAADAPIALVTFVMSKIQLFRAAVGLPPELETSRATSRCDSFCQFVVKTDAPFIVEDARHDDRVPKAMVDTYGIAAYLGVPIQVGGQALGSLCVADGKERSWRPGLVDDLTVLASRVSNRLTEIKAQGETVAAPAAGSPRELAADVSSLAHVIQRALSEAGPMLRLAKGMSAGMSPDAVARAASVLTEASNFYEDMFVAVAELCSQSERLEHLMEKA